MGRRQTVLIVEDDQDLRHLLRTALFLAGYDVGEARGGFEALRLPSVDTQNRPLIDS
jgi:DNA-binding response OmpR family regulator